MFKDDIYSMEITTWDEGGQALTRNVPCYTCGHCSNIIALRGDRLRERKHCLSCSRLICEKSEICNTHCTPLHRLADDGFEAAGKWGLYVPAIMQGVTTKEEAEEKGLLKEV